MDPVAVSSSALRTIETGREGFEEIRSSNNSRRGAVRRFSERNYNSGGLTRSDPSIAYQPIAISIVH